MQGGTSGVKCHRCKYASKSLVFSTATIVPRHIVFAFRDLGMVSKARVLRPTRRPGPRLAWRCGPSQLGYGSLPELASRRVPNAGPKARFPAILRPDLGQCAERAAQRSRFSWADQVLTFDDRPRDFRHAWHCTPALSTHRRAGCHGSRADTLTVNMSTRELCPGHCIPAWPCLRHTWVGTLESRLS